MESADIVALHKDSTERLRESAQGRGIGTVDVQVQAAPALRRPFHLLEGQLRRSRAGGLEPDELLEAGRHRSAQQCRPKFRQAPGVRGVDHDRRDARCGRGAGFSDVHADTVRMQCPGGTERGSQSTDSGTPVRSLHRIPRMGHGMIRRTAGSRIHQ
ncbi:hypothetical protein ASE96_12625 [Arthrobacter sp. Leaf69]|nr:hypothetical protein ASE96_12625 [Arthrobacter sp. Leaf69]